MGAAPMWRLDPDVYVHSGYPVWRTDGTKVPAPRMAAHSRWICRPHPDGVELMDHSRPVDKHNPSVWVDLDAALGHVESLRAASL